MFSVTAIVSRHDINLVPKPGNWSRRNNERGRQVRLVVSEGKKVDDELPN